MICVASVLVAVSACVIFDCSEALEMPPLKSVAMLLICCSQLPIALQTLLAYASFALRVGTAAAAARRDEREDGEHRQHRYGGPAAGGETLSSNPINGHRATSSFSEHGSEDVISSRALKTDTQRSPW